MVGHNGLKRALGQGAVADLPSFRAAAGPGLADAECGEVVVKHELLLVLFLKAVDQAKRNDMATIALTGGRGGQLAAKADIAVTAPSRVTARIQEAHIFLLHLWADAAEASLASAKES